MTLTQNLLQSWPEGYKEATQHPFLYQVGKRTLPVGALSEWLAQDYIYALRFALFIKDQKSILSKRSEVGDLSMEWLAKYGLLLENSAVNIELELDFFEDISKRYGLNIELASRQDMEDQTRRANSVTKSYVELKQQINTVEEGAVLLWGMEKCYFDAWTFASRQTPSPDAKSPVSALDELIGRWSTVEFKDFVEKLAFTVDSLPPLEGDIKESVNRLWKKLIDLERRFWPVV